MSQLQNTIQTVAKVTRAAAQYLPEPARTGVGLFQDAINTVANAGQNALSGSDLSSAGSFASLIETQIEIQKELQAATMVSNVEKSKHEANMAPIRNIRVSG